MDSLDNLQSNIDAISPPFGKWRRRLWPIHNNELKKLLPLLFIKFLVSFNYVILHDTKDTLIVTTAGSGAEAIPILKGWVVIFFAFIAMMIYSKLSSHLSKRALFYTSMMPFILFFAVYGFILYPCREWLTPHASADWLLDIFGREREHWVSVYRYWMNSLFFLMAELWGGVVIALLFWGFANQISNINEASRFYTLFSAGGHIGTIMAGPVVWHYTQSFNKDQYTLTVQNLMGIVTIASLLIVFAYWWTNRYALKEKEEKKSENTASKVNKPKLPLGESLKFILCSPYLGCIALMVIGYGMSVSMVEVSWKALLKIAYPAAKDYQAFMAIVSFATGCVSLLFSLFVGGNILRKFGWLFAAQLTPIVLGVCSVAFFGFYFADTSLGAVISLTGTSFLFPIIFCGAIHNISCKSMKYCLFDPTKEMAYIPLDDESKTKGKAAVDVVAARFGKAGSSWIQAGLIEFVGLGSILGIVPYLAPIVLGTVVVWIVAAYLLNNRFQNTPNYVSYVTQQQ